jgi:hypothetical protein
MMAIPLERGALCALLLLLALALGADAFVTPMR